MPTYRFLTRHPGHPDGEMVEGEFPNDDAAVKDAHLALADLVRDDILDHTDTPEEIEVVNEHHTRDCDGTAERKVNLMREASGCDPRLP